MLQGFGHLVPSIEPSDVLGVLYESSVFKEHNDKDQATTRITVSIIIFLIFYLPQVKCLSHCWLYLYNRIRMFGGITTLPCILEIGIVILWCRLLVLVLSRNQFIKNVVHSLI